MKVKKGAILLQIIVQMASYPVWIATGYSIVFVSI